nr:PREDICTED: stAR-related lipid transfer protein 8-like [Opisthocomus hoazin]
MEKYSVPHKQAWTWTVPKFMKRSKVPDYRDKTVFGVPPTINEQRLQAVQAAVILMPDENREVLQTLLYFLSDIASAEENQMTAGNLAVCLAPSIFHLNVSKKESTSPRAIHKRGTMGKPDQKDLNENMAATQGLSHMITDCKKLFQVSHDILLQLSSSYMAADAYPHPLADFVCQGESKDLHSYFEQSVQNLLKESSEKFKGWLSTPGPLNTQLSCKKVNATVGRSPEWYNKVFGHLCAMELARIRDSFPALSPSSPETKL